MKNWLTYLIFLIVGLTGCEEIYNPEIEAVENVIVADARVVAGKNSEIVLYQSLGYNDKSATYPSVSGASVSIISDKGTEIKLRELATGHFPVFIGTNSSIKYKMKIVHGSNTYESEFEPVPGMPEIDTVFGVPGTKIIAADGENDADEFIEIEGVQLYCNILDENALPYFRFTATQIMQYYYYVEVPFFGSTVIRAMWGWNSEDIGQSFNIAAPPEYGTTNIILKHPLYFMPKKVYIDNGYSFDGWILILHQQRISQSGYLFYKDLNNQLEASGNLFDPMYVQAKNNLKCMNNPEQKILGNFEISAAREYRYYVHYLSYEKGYLVKPIPYFYQIPPAGEILETRPDFWEYENKLYPTK